LAAASEGDGNADLSHNWALGKNGLVRHRVYLWIEDEAESLNVVLVRQGRYPAPMMADMVENDREMLETVHDEGLAKELAERPEG